MHGRFWRILAAVALALFLVASPLVAQSDEIGAYARSYVQAVGYAAENAWFARGLSPSQLYQASLNAMTEHMGATAPKLTGDPNKDRDTAVAFLREALAASPDEQTRNELFRVAVTGILRQWDRWTYALTPLERLFNYAENGYFDEGDGVILNSVPTRDVYVVDEVIPDTPGARVDIKVGDVVVAINGVPVPQLYGNDALMYRLERDAREKRKITYTIKRADTMFDVEVDYLRRETPVVRAEMLSPDIGYIWLPGFIASTGHEFAEALDAFRAMGMTALVIDLRGNQGGSLWEAQILLSQFLQGPLFGFRSRKVGTEIFSSVIEHPLDIPVAVILDKNSASASEIVAFILRDRPKTRLFGVNITTTYGKGVGQSSYLLANGWLYAFTTLEVVSPSGESYEGKGVRVHEVINTDDVKKPSSADPAVQRAIQWLKAQK